MPGVANLYNFMKEILDDKWECHEIDYFYVSTRMVFTNEKTLYISTGITFEIEIKFNEQIYLINIHL